MNARCKSFVLSLRRWLPPGLLVRATLSASLLSAAFLSGCATQNVTAITLSGVVRNEQTALTGNIPPQVAQLVRNGTSYQFSPGVALQPGDALWTGPDAAAVISYPGGARAYVYPNTRVRIGSIIDDIGKVFVKVKGAFKVQTNFVTAGSEGTQYWVDVQALDQVKVVVVEGVVRLSSNAAIWPARALRGNEQAQISGANAPVQGPANAADIRRETDWVNRMDRLVPVPTSISTGALVGIGAAIGAAIIIHNSGSSRQDPVGRQPTPGTSSQPPYTPPSPPLSPR
jgi:hypothetical protein